MLRRIQPERIICYNEPFPEMQGNIIFVDYELSSWKYQNDDYRPSKYVPYILGEKSLPENSGIVIKGGCILKNDFGFKGMGSAFGGGWQPHKQDDERFLGEPSEVKQSQSNGKRGGYARETKIGEDGRATGERHHTDHDSPGSHTNPHDHKIDWSGGFPRPGPPINYPDGAPAFKSYRGVKDMSEIVKSNTPEENRFKTISDFKWCVNGGGEIEFSWNEKTFGIFPLLQKTPSSPQQILLIQKFVENQKGTEMWYDTADDLLEYTIDGDRLRDIITEVEVTDRTI